MTFPIADIAQRNTVRVIPTGRLKEPSLLPLAPNHGALKDLEGLELLTNSRVRAQEHGTEDLNPQELTYGRSHSTIVNAAFTHRRKGGNRFNDESRGAWYCSFEVKTSLQEVAFHLTRELENVGRFENITEYSEFFADFIGPFHDLRGVEPKPACLDPDPAIGYPAGKALAREVLSADGNGIIYPSARAPEGTCLVALRPDLVQNVRQGAVWRLEWQGSPTPVITQATR